MTHKLLVFRDALADSRELLSLNFVEARLEQQFPRSETAQSDEQQSTSTRPWSVNLTTPMTASEVYVVSSSHSETQTVLAADATLSIRGNFAALLEAVKLYAMNQKTLDINGLTMTHGDIRVSFGPAMSLMIVELTYTGSAEHAHEILEQFVADCMPDFPLLRSFDSRAPNARDSAGSATALGALYIAMWRFLRTLR